MNENIATQINEVASSLHYDVTFLEYHTASGYISLETWDRVRTILRDIENSVEQLKGLIESNES